METILDDLLGVLEQEAELYRRFREVLDRERRALTALALDDLYAAGNEKETLTLRARILEESRRNLLTRLAAGLDLPPDRLTLSLLAATVQEPYASRFTRCREALLRETQDVQEGHALNATLVERSLDYIRESILLLNSAVPGPTYLPSGQMQAAAGGLQTLSREA